MRGDDTRDREVTKATQDIKQRIMMTTQQQQQGHHLE